MNNLEKAVARKVAMIKGIRTSDWDNAKFEAFIAEYGIQGHENLMSAEELKARYSEEVPVAVEAPAPAPTGSSLEDAIIAAVQGKVSGQIDEARVVELIQKHSNAPRLTNIEILDEPKQQIISRESVHKDYPIVMGHIAAGVDTAVVGPAGSGKSTMFAQIAEDLGLNYYIVSSPQMRSEIMGYMDANGQYVRTPIREAYEHGGLIVVEEYDGSNPKALLSANNLVANSTTDFPDGMVKKHENFVCVMAGNTYGHGANRQYVGRTQIDGATLDRFAFLDIGYDEALELHAAKCAYDHPATEAWVAEVQAFRANVEARGVRHIVSPRASIMGAKLLKQGLSREVIVKSVLHKGLAADQIKQLAA